MMGHQCDNCRAFASHPSAGWLFLARQQSPDFASVMFGGGNGGAELAGTFCSMRCAAEWTYAHAVIAEAPSTGTGWPS